MTWFSSLPWPIRIVVVVTAADVAFCATALVCQWVRGVRDARRFRRYLVELQREADELLAVDTLARMIAEGESA